jgi:hypothetical protein
MRPVCEKCETKTSLDHTVPVDLIIKLLLFLLVFLQTPLDLIFETQKDRSRLGTLKVSF